MKVRDVMTRKVESIKPDSPVKEAAQRMKEADIGFVPIHDGKMLHGVVTDRDIALRTVAEGREPRTTVVRDIMTDHVHCCVQDDSVEQAARVMEECKVRRLVVVDGDRRMVGVVSLGDLALSPAGTAGLAGEVLERVSQPGTPHRQG